MLKNQLKELTDKVSELMEDYADLSENVTDLKGENVSYLEKVVYLEKESKRVTEEMEERSLAQEAFKKEVDDHHEEVMNVLRGCSAQLGGFQTCISEQTFDITGLQHSFDEVARIVNRFWTFFSL